MTKYLSLKHHATSDKHKEALGDSVANKPGFDSLFLISSLGLPFGKQSKSKR
jgi:hypothetical protein